MSLFPFPSSSEIFVACPNHVVQIFANDKYSEKIMNLPIKAEGGFKLDNITNAIIDVSKFRFKDVNWKKKKLDFYWQFHI